MHDYELKIFYYDSNLRSTDDVNSSMHLMEHSAIGSAIHQVGLNLFLKLKQIK